jgi:hypothetical protein
MHPSGWLGVSGVKNRESGFQEAQLGVNISGCGTFVKLKFRGDDIQI